jgi:hypothetical protein
VVAGIGACLIAAVERWSQLKAQKMPQTGYNPGKYEFIIAKFFRKSSSNVLYLTNI